MSARKYATLAECQAYLAANGHQADYVRVAPGAAKAAKAVKARSDRASMLASFGVVYTPKQKD